MKLQELIEESLKAIDISEFKTLIELLFYPNTKGLRTEEDRLRDLGRVLLYIYLMWAYDKRLQPYIDAIYHEEACH